MATRTQARESVIGLLYAHDLGNEKISLFANEILEDKKIRNNQKNFALKLFNGVLNNIEIINNEIISHLEKRGIEDIGSVERSILRLAIYEILFENLDKPVAINEAIELSKKLASDNAPKFINGLLDKVNN